MRLTLQQPNTRHRTLLYRVVFGATWIRLVIAVMFIFFFMQPVLPAFAAEESATDVSEQITEAETVSETEPEEPESVVSEEVHTENKQNSDVPLVTAGVTNDDGGAEVLEVVSEENISSGTESETQTAVVNDVVNVVSNGVPSGDATDMASSTIEAPVTMATSTVFGTTTAIAVQDQVATTTIDDTLTNASTTVGDINGSPVDLNESPMATSTTKAAEKIVSDNEEKEEPSADILSADETASTTEPETQVIYVERLAQDPNLVSFNVDNCISVGDGSFYCQSESQDTLPSPSTAVYVDQDNEGDLEVFYQHDGKVTQLSDNQFDDAAPDFDPESNTVVWHRLINDSYQIVVYDLQSEEELVITDTIENDMEPTHEKGVTVWQRWVGNDWEIMLADEDGITQLTDNEVHDVAPDIKNGFVMWNTTGAYGVPQVAVYEIATGLTSTIADSDGGQVTNPRFVLVYDTKFANGDIITKGFNPETGEVEPLNAQPADMPQDIPSSDPVGETRALLQNKSTSEREDVEVGSADQPKNSSIDSNVVTEKASTTTAVVEGVSETASTTLVIADAEVIATSTEILPLTDFDLIVEPYSSATSSQVNNSASSSNLVE